MNEHKKNHLAYEKSPYLLQHSDNPVDWYPWGKEAFEKAKRENKPIFLSIGYSTCHWCHVMERESFENEEIAEILNRSFVSIKVDREEHPDVDAFYIRAAQIISGSAGWPLSVFLLPSGEPFFAGTYFPEQTFKRILLRIEKVWKEQRANIKTDAQKLMDYINKSYEQITSPVLLNRSILDRAYNQLRQSFDGTYGGFGNAPKFPTPHQYAFLLRYYSRTKNEFAKKMVELSLKKMAEGGIFDHIGGGFHRYSTDRQWIVPHFEKMLYDNALLAKLYLETFIVTGRELFKEVATRTLDFMLGEMQNPEGGFYSAFDADSKEGEGFFYLWTKNEIMKVLGKEKGKIFCEVYGVEDQGNFEGRNILHIEKSPETLVSEEKKNIGEIKKILRESREKLFQYRAKRERPFLDKKIITSWNGLVISALSYAYQVIGDEKYLSPATRTAEFLLNKLRDRKGNLYRRIVDGERKYSGNLEDYAFFIQGLLDLYEASFNEKYFTSARELADKMLEIFYDKGLGGFFDSPSLIGGGIIPFRAKEGYDGATPSGNSVAILNLLRLYEFTAEERYEKKALESLRYFQSTIEKHPAGYTKMLIGLDFYLGPAYEIVLVGKKGDKETLRSLKHLQTSFIPRTVKGFIEEDQKSAIPLMEDRTTLDGKTTLYICERFKCKLPVTGYENIANALNKLN